MSDGSIRVDGTLSSAEQQELIVRSTELFGEPPSTPDSKVLPALIGIGIVVVLALFAILRDAAVPAGIGALLVGIVGGYILGLRRVGAVGNHLTGWSFRPDGARDHFESGGYLFHPWSVLQVVHAEWGVLAAAEGRPVLFVPARLLRDRGGDDGRAARIVALAEAGGATVRREG